MLPSTGSHREGYQACTHLGSIDTQEDLPRGVTVPFMADRGQADKRVAFFAQTFGGIVSVTSSGEIVYSLPARGPAAGGVVLKETFVGGVPPKVEGRLEAGRSKESCKVVFVR